jgi:hypothetical protein
MDIDRTDIEYMHKARVALFNATERLTYRSDCDAELKEILRRCNREIAAVYEAMDNDGCFTGKY